MSQCKICNRETVSGFRCSTCVSKIRRATLKIIAVEYKGGKCVSCGYNDHPAALQFHHTNPSEKEFTISTYLIKRTWDEIKLELDKCTMLCSNCHAIQHQSRYDDKILSEVEAYKHNFKPRKEKVGKDQKSQTQKDRTARDLSRYYKRQSG